MFSETTDFTLISIVILTVELLGIAAAVNAITTSRTAQSAIAWTVALITFPWVTLILYAIFGRNKFHGYVTLRHAQSAATAHLLERLQQEASAKDVMRTALNSNQHAFVSLAQMPITRYNRCRLLLDGQTTFEQIFGGMEKAVRFVLVQFYIVHDDELGRELKKRMIQKAREGVDVYFLYDEIGSFDLPQSYIGELRRAGVAVSAFHSTKGRANRFQINFRNHRKIVIVDGIIGYVGGHNVGDEYISSHEKFGAWRDTHVEVEGPATMAMQFAFIEDWYWATGTLPGLQWPLQKVADGKDEVLVIPSGPADVLETCGLMFLHAIHSARERFWMATPYFIPDDKLLAAMKLAVLRGVDVRIILPEKPDHRLMHLASFANYERLIPVGIRMFRFKQGFMHQKVFLVDSECAAIGTANLDNRSFRLNFEVTLLNYNPTFIRQIEKMLVDDMARCRPVTLEDYTRRSIFFKFAVKAVGLLEPIL